jgi:hypothetical protein
MEDRSVYEYILQEEQNYRTVRIPLTGSKDWNMAEHIERCTNVANAWYHSGKNDGSRPYDDIVTPVINVAFRTEGFDAKDIVPFVDDIDKSHLSFIIKKYHPQWARAHELDTFIDDLVETSVIYDLALIKNVNNVLPEVIDLRNIAFCDQTDVLAGPLCIKHYFTPSELMDYASKWDASKVEEAIVLSKASKEVAIANDKEAKTPGKYIEVYELRGDVPEKWLPEGDKGSDKYVPQMQLVCFYKDVKGNKCGITLYAGKDKPLKKNFKALKIDRIRSKGRACGRSIVETLFEPQVWNNYSAIKVKQLLDSALQLFYSDDPELKGQKLTDLKLNTILSTESGKSINKVDGSLDNLPHFQNYQNKQANDARTLGSASEAQLGKDPASGTPFKLQELVVQQGEGVHEYRQGKIATFFADQLYRDWILQYMVDDLNKGITFSELLSLDELNQVVLEMSENLAEEEIKNQVLQGKLVTEEDRPRIKAFFAEQVRKKYEKRGFFEIVKDELKKVPLSVMVNVNGKQRYMAQNADKITNLIREIIKSPTAFSSIPGLGKLTNQLLEESGLNPIDFKPITTPLPVTAAAPPKEEAAVN